MRIVFTLLSISALSACLVAFDSSVTRANHTGGMNVWSLDMDEEATPANTATSLGSRQICQRINENNLMDADEDVVDGIKIDVTARDIPAYNNGGTPGNPTDDAGGIIAYVYLLNYSSANLTVQAQEADTAGLNLLRANGTSPLFNASDTAPDDNSDNQWNSALLDTGISTPEQGSGNLERLTLVSEAFATTGAYPLTFKQGDFETGHLDAQGAFYKPDTIEGAYVAVNAACGDFDADGVPDEQDACMDIPGSPAHAGCPPPGPPAVGGTAGLLDSRADDGGPPVIAAALAVGTIALLAGASLTWRRAARRIRR